jgi:hypothetical protein
LREESPAMFRAHQVPDWLLRQEPRLLAQEPFKCMIGVTSSGRSFDQKKAFRMTAS